MEKQENTGALHKSVLLNEVLEAFRLSRAHLNKGIKIIDATLGLGGHTLEFVKRGADVLGFDHDREMLNLAEQRLKSACPIPNKKNWGSYKLINASFRKIAEYAGKEGFTDCDGILFDLGVSSPQITSRERGFSFQNDQSELDMRMNKEGDSVKGKDLLNLLREDQLVMLFSQVMDPGLSRRLSKAVVEYRKANAFETVGDFKIVIESVIFKKSKSNVATKPFLALRIAVNSEMENVKESLPQAFELLRSGGRLAVISFNSLEDSVVKQILKSLTENGTGIFVNEKPILPSEAEMSENVRSRSAKLRIIEHL